MADIGEAAVDHHLHAIAAAALVAMAEEFDIARRDGIHGSILPIYCYDDTSFFCVMPALVAGIHVFGRCSIRKTWMAGTSLAMTR